uniref:Uncharacterized protein n=1 Tax=Solanum lycopersicum TaxID=4081 RepID=A0A3Q7IN64_SOLLC
MSYGLCYYFVDVAMHHFDLVDASIEKMKNMAKDVEVNGFNPGLIVLLVIEGRESLARHTSSKAIRVATSSEFDVRKKILGEHNSIPSLV